MTAVDVLVVAVSLMAGAGTAFGYWLAVRAELRARPYRVACTTCDFDIAGSDPVLVAQLGELHSDVPGHRLSAGVSLGSTT